MIAICIGHDRLHQGADPDGSGPGLAEWAFHREVGHQVVKELNGLGTPATLFLRPESGGDTVARMRSLAAAVNAAHPDLVVELHANAVPPGHPDWDATFALHWPGSGAGESLGRVVAAAAAGVLGTRDRGSRPQAKSEAGLPLVILQATLAPAVIVETHNVQHPAVRARAMAARSSGELARALALALHRHLRGAP